MNTFISSLKHDTLIDFETCEINLKSDLQDYILQQIHTETVGMNCVSESAPYGKSINLLSAVPKGSVMVPLRRNAMTMQTLRRSREPVLVRPPVLVSRPITALAAVSPRRKVNNFWEAHVRRLRWMQGGSART